MRHLFQFIEIHLLRHTAAPLPEALHVGLHRAFAPIMTRDKRFVRGRWIDELRTRAKAATTYAHPSSALPGIESFQGRKRAERIVSTTQVSTRARDL